MATPPRHLPLNLSRPPRRAEIAGAPEAQVLAFIGSLPRTRDFILSATHRSPDKVAVAYQPVWASHAAVLRLLMQRHEGVEAARKDSPEALEHWQRLADIRRRTSRLVLSPAGDLAARDRALEALAREQAKEERLLLKLLPEVERHRDLARRGPTDLVDHLPKGSAFIDFVRYTHHEKGKTEALRYLAFVLVRGRKVERVELDDAQPIDDAIASWRRSIARHEASLAPARLRVLLWNRVAAKLPPGTDTVYLCPDGDLRLLPFAALPGKKKGTVLLEDHALAVVPAGSWLLLHLLHPQRPAPAPQALLAVGNVAYGKAAGKDSYEALPRTAQEIKQVLAAFGNSRDALLEGNRASPRAVLDGLSRARYAHLATHGYFDARALSEEHGRRRELWKRWVFHREGTPGAGLGARNPLAFVGLVLAGANQPSSSDRGILTGLDLLDLPLGKMRLCVLSACETGLGEWQGEEGVAGLQRALHVAGCPNVVGSLWEVDDAATAALMAQFYHELRVNKRGTLAALREAQLTIYRHPGRIGALAGQRGRPALEKAARLGSRGDGPKSGTRGKADTRLWAGFFLSGPGT